MKDQKVVEKLQLDLLGFQTLSQKSENHRELYNAICNELIDVLASVDREVKITPHYAKNYLKKYDLTGSEVLNIQEINEVTSTLKPLEIEDHLVNGEKQNEQIMGGQHDGLDEVLWPPFC